MAKLKQDAEVLGACDKAITLLTNLVERTNECIAELQHYKADLTAEPSVKAAVVEEDKPKITLEDVRTTLADLSRKGYTANVRMMLVGLGVSKLSEVDPKDYAELLAKAQELQDVIKD